MDNALVDRSVQRAQPLDVWQFERLGYFCVDSDSTRDRVRICDKYFIKVCYFRDTVAGV